MSNSIFGKTMENVRNHRYSKLAITGERRNKLVSEPNYHTTKHFSENLLKIEMKKTKVRMNKPIYILACQYQILAKHLFMNLCRIALNQNMETKQNYVTDSFVIHLKTEDFYRDIANDVER